MNYTTSSNEISASTVTGVKMLRVFSRAIPRVMKLSVTERPRTFLCNIPFGRKTPFLWAGKVLLISLLKLVSSGSKNK